MPAVRVLEATIAPSPEPGTVLVETERLILRRLAPSDIDEFAECVNHPEVLENLSDHFSNPFLKEHAEAFMARKTFPDTPEYPTAVGIFAKPGSPANENGTEPRMVGNCGLQPMQDIKYRTWHLGYFITKSAWRNGYATEAISAIVNFAFDTWPQLLRVEAHAYDRNIGSQAVLRKVGFTQEGILRSNIEKRGVVMDDLVFGILRNEVKRCKEEKGN